MTELEREVWQARAAAHEARVDVWVQPHLERRQRGEKHPVHDFLFGYYSHRPAALRRWHPGLGVTLLDAPEYDGAKAYEVVQIVLVGPDGSKRQERSGLRVSEEWLSSQRPLLEATLRLLEATAGRTATFGCFGLHEWAMVHSTLR